MSNAASQQNARKFSNPFSLLSSEEGLFVAHITSFIHNRHNREIDRNCLFKKLKRLEYRCIIEEMHTYLSQNRQSLAKDFSQKKLSPDDEWKNNCLAHMTDYALQDFIFSETISSICMASIRTKISFLEDFQLIEQCASLREKPMDFFEISPLITELSSVTFKKAIEELNTIESFVTPAQMMRCILNTINSIFKEIEGTCQFQHLSADDLLPILIYVIVQAKDLQNPFLIVEYTQQLALQEGEAAYNLVLFESALHAIKHNLLQTNENPTETTVNNE